MTGLASFRALAAALAVATAIALGGVAHAVEPSGSKNFTAPRDVPNYFSNEAGSINGGASAHPPPAAPVYAAPVPRPPARSYAVAARSYHGRMVARGRQHVAHGRLRGHLRVARSGGRGAYVRAAHVRAVARSGAAGRHGRFAAAGGRTVAHARR